MAEPNEYEWHEFSWEEAPKMPPGPHKKLKLLADANIPKPLIDELRAAGVRVESVTEMGLGRHPDENVSQLSKRSKSILLTMDRDFWDDRQHPFQNCPEFIFVDVSPDRAELAVDGLARFYALFTKFYPLDWWREMKARIFERGFSVKMRTWAGKTAVDTFKLTDEGKLLTRTIR